MNPYWINQAPDTDEFLHSDRVRQNFILLAAGHIVLWILSFCGIVYLYSNAQTTAPIEAFSYSGEINHGKLVSSSTPEAAQKREAFLQQHFKNIFSHLFMRTEKGMIPELKYYTDEVLLAIVDANFNFSDKKKGGYSQTLQISPEEKDFEKIGEANNGNRRIYRIHGTMASHSLEGSANFPVYFIAAIDRRKPTEQNPMGWVVSVIISVDAKEFYNRERKALIDEVTKPRSDAGEKKETMTPATGK